MEEEVDLAEKIKLCQKELHDWKARKFRARTNEERIECTNHIGELTQRIRRYAMKLEIKYG